MQTGSYVYNLVVTYLPDYLVLFYQINYFVTVLLTDLPTCPPVCFQEQLRKYILEGSNAIFTNLPHPRVLTKYDHAYVLPSECVADLLAHGRIDSRGKNSPVQSLAESFKANLLADRDKAFGAKSIFLSLWSDDFDPNYSTKNNRGSIWIMTLCVQTIKSGNPTIDCVYPIAMGDKDADHREITGLLLDDIKELEATLERKPKVMWNGHTKKNEAVSCHLIALVQDQPERRKFNGLLAGGKGPHARFGWWVPMSQFVDNINPCDVCRDLLAKNYPGDQTWIPNRGCPDCHCWMADHESMKCDPGEPYPTCEMPSGEKLLAIRYSNWHSGKTFQCLLTYLTPFPNCFSHMLSPTKPE